jgi:hypothetical protein
MTDTGIDDDPDGLAAEDVESTDYLLELLVKLLGVEAGDTRLSLTLMTSGGILSGEAVSLGTWERAIETALTGAQSDGSGDGLPGVLRVHVDAFAAAHESRRERGLSTPVPRFVHLRNARLWTATHSREVGLWRVRIDKIDGWSLGTWS